MLYGAVLTDDVDGARRAIENGAEVNEATHSKWTPLLMAALRGKFEFVELLVESGAHVNQAQVFTCMSPLFVAAREGHADVVRLLIERGATQRATSEEVSPLLAACEYNEVDCARLLLEHSPAEIDKACRDKTTPLVMAAGKGHVECLQLLLDNATPSTVDAQAAGGRTALLCAVQEGHVDCGRLLLEHGAAPNKDSAGRTPLCAAAFLGHVELCRMLVHHGAEVDKANKHTGETPLVTAARYDKPDCVRALIDVGADLELRDYAHNSALSLACGLGYFDVAVLLVEAGANVNTVDANWKTPLWLAADGPAADPNIVALLLRQRRDIRHDAMTNAASIMYIVRSRGFFAGLPWLPFADLGHRCNGETLLQRFQSAHLASHRPVRDLVVLEHGLMVEPVQRDDSVRASKTSRSCGGGACS